MTLGVFVDAKDFQNNWIHAMPSQVFALNFNGMLALAKFLTREFLDSTLNDARHSDAVKRFCISQDFFRLRKMFKDQIRFRYIEIY